MSAGSHPLKITLDGSGEGSGQLTVYGIVGGVRVERSSGSPVVTVAETSGTQETLLDGVTVASNTTYSPQKEIQDNSGTGTGLYTPYILNGNVTVTVTSGAAAGTVTVYVKAI